MDMGCLQRACRRVREGGGQSLERDALQRVRAALME
jgi:hypothetical protein